MSLLSKYQIDYQIQKIKIYIDEDKDKTYFGAFKNSLEILKSSNVSDEKINQIFTLLQG